MRNYRTFYMHTLDGKPAQYDRKEGLRLAQKSKAMTLVPALDTLKRQQCHDEWLNGDRAEYGYVIVHVPVERLERKAKEE